MSAYGNAIDFKIYHTTRGRTIPVTWTDAIITAALLRASEWLDNRFDSSWFGYATDGFTQERKWPRTCAMTNTFPTYVFDTDEIPDSVINATYEAAFRETTEAESLCVDFVASKYKSVQVSGAVSVDYVQNLDSSDSQIQIPIVESLMAPLIDPSKGGASSTLSGPLTRI